MAVKKTTAAEQAATEQAQEAAQTAQEATEAVTVDNSTPAAETVQEAAQEAAETVTLVYVGPSLPKGQLKQNSIFIGTRQEIEKELEAVLEKFPLAKKLLVPVADLATAKTKVKSAGNVLHKWYADVSSLIDASFVKEG